ncbi:cobyric acid synthase [Deinococcus roseus]|nr:cobyric acid synthase [Deinococcus roseus]
MHKKPLKTIMLMGCTSDAGKSFLTAALCRHYANLGYQVRPFKAQNMSNFAAVTRDGLEIGRAQYLQALAARVLPDVRMNPVLLKPMADTRSAVVVMGKPDPEISALPWFDRKPRLWGVVQEALHSLQQEAEILIIEGAGSPAEINLKKSDIVNMRVAKEAQAEVYLIADIDKGGAFAHLLGTWMCLDEEERSLVKGFILNKFRGDKTLLREAPMWLEQQTGIPVVAIVDMLPNKLPEEDTLHYRAEPRFGVKNIALLCYPYASNLDEFDPLVHQSGVQVVPLRDLQNLEVYDALILPGSRNTAESLRWLDQTGWKVQVQQFASTGKPVLGICGGMQLLGRRLLDPHNIESGDAEGLGLLEVETTLDPDKTTLQTCIPYLDGEVSGYEIHHGITRNLGATPWLPHELGWQQGNVRGAYLHGLFENRLFVQEFLNILQLQAEVPDWSGELEQELNRIAEQAIKTSGWEGFLS